MTHSGVGTSVTRRDLRDKLTGQARYSADLKLPGMLHGMVLRSPHPHADILSIDTSQAAGLPGVHAIVTPFDAPKGWVAPDMPLLDTRVRFAGDEVGGGGISQMLGFTLSEELVTDGPTGVTLNPNYLEHKSPTILDYPEIQVIFADVVDPLGPCWPRR